MADENQIAPEPQFIGIYHGGACRDGFCCAWLLHHMIPGIELVPAQYGEEPPDVTGKNVIIADFSYPRDQLLNIASKAHSLCVFDHHKTARWLQGFAIDCAKMGHGYPIVVFDEGRSGAGILWDYLYERHFDNLGELIDKTWVGCGLNSRDPLSINNPPRLVAYVQDRDLWNFSLYMSREINAYIRSYPLTIDNFDLISRSLFSDCLRGQTTCIDQGSAIIRMLESQVDTHVRHAEEMVIAGETVLAVNCTDPTLFSDVAGTLAEGRPFGATYFVKGDGTMVFQLRSRGDAGVDVSEVAAKYGGGGHKNAAGFVIGPGGSLELQSVESADEAETAGHE